MKVFLIVFTCIIGSFTNAFCQAKMPDDSLDLDIVEISLPTYNIIHGFYKIVNDEQYQKLQNDVIKISDPPRNYVYPNIDFNKHLLMGVRVLNEGCEKMILNKSLIQNNKDSVTTFNLELIQTGQCLDVKAVNYWIILDKKHGFNYVFNHNLIKK